MGVRIQELPETTGINKEDVLIVEDGQGTKKGTVQQLDEALGVSQLKEDLDNHIGKNMCGMNPNVFYPVLLKSGDTITMSTSDGSVNDRLTNLRFYDKDKNLVYEKSFLTGVSQRTVSIDKNIPEIRYINWSYRFGKVYQVERGSNATGFEEYKDMLDLNSALKKSAYGYFTLDLFFDFINAGLLDGQLTDRQYRAASKNIVSFIFRT